MALSNSSRKNAYERAIVRQRDRESSSRQRWEDNAKYFHDSGIQANKFETWAKTPITSAPDSMETFKRHHELEMRQMQIQRRRAELAKLLKDENIEYEMQLRTMSKDDVARLMAMREQVDSFRSAREGERQQIADEKLYEHWRLNNPAIRKVESENLRQYVADSWNDQVSDRRGQRAADQAAESEWNRRMEATARQDSARRVAEMETRRQMEMEYRESLRQQAEEVAKREAENQIIEVEERAIFDEMGMLEKLQQERKEVESRRKREEHGKILKKQHTARLMRISRQVQAELEEDRMFLAELAARQARDEGNVSDRREAARADAAWMQRAVEDQMRLEKQREAELEQLYAEEAEREWQKREAEWNKERVARERLMQEVLKERQFQLQDKYDKLRERQHEIASQRVQIEQDLAQADLDTVRERVQNERERDVRRLALEEQMAQERAAAASNAMATQLEAAEEAKLAEEMDDLVRIETARLRKKKNEKEPFEPLIQGKRVTWR